MNEKSKNIPNDPDTDTLVHLETKFGLYDCVYQQWLFDGIKGNSLIFHKEDLKDIDIDSIKEEIKTSNLLTDESATITSSSNVTHDYVFFNFNFETIK